MVIEKLKEFAKNGQKNTDELDLEAGFAVNKKPARQWFNWLFNTLTLKINEIIDADYIQHDEITDNLTTNDAKKPLSAKQGKNLQDNKVEKSESFKDSFGGNVDYYQDSLTPQFFTSFDEFPVGSRCLIGSTLNLINEPLFSDQYFYVETIQTFEIAGKLQIAYGYTTGKVAIRSAGTSSPFGEWAYAATLDSNVASASKLQNARTITASGAASGSVVFDGSKDAQMMLTLANSGVVAGTYGSALKIPTLTVNEKGLITVVSEKEITKVNLGLDKFSQNPNLNTAIGAPDVDAAIIISNHGWGIYKNSSAADFNPALPLASGGTGRTDGKAHALVSPRKIFGQTFDGSSDVNGTVTSSAGMFSADEYHYIDVGRNGLDRMNFYNLGGNFNFIDSSTGYILARLSLNGIDCNAATASKLQTARKINGIDFDGSVDITLPTATTSASGTVQLNDTLTSTSKTQALTAAQGKAINDRFTNDFINLKAGNGYQKLPGGLILQWGVGSTSVNTVFPLVFPNAVSSIALAIQAGSSRADNIFYNQLTKFGFTSWGRTPDGNEATLGFTYLVIGY